jgi:hypothetical protein
VGLEPTTRGLKGCSIAATVASTCDYSLTASPTSPTTYPWATSFHATNHATRLITSSHRRTSLSATCSPPHRRVGGLLAPPVQPLQGEPQHPGVGAAPVRVSDRVDHLGVADCVGSRVSPVVPGSPGARRRKTKENTPWERRSHSTYPIFVYREMFSVIFSCTGRRRRSLRAAPPPRRVHGAAPCSAAGTSCLEPGESRVCQRGDRACAH